MNPEEDDIIARCRKYDTDAQQALYNKYRKKMFGVCIQYVNYEDARDLLQEGFIKIFTNIHQFNGSGSFEGWMRRIIVTTILMELRKRKKLHFDSIENLNISDPEEKAETEELETHLNELTEKDLLDLLDKLPYDLRIIFNLHCIEEHSHKEIASLLSISESNSRIRLMRARKALQKYIYERMLK